MKLDPSQERAIALIMDSPIGIVTGGPGTGKTTSLGVALDRFDAAGVTYALAAPTGKAARRMAEATGRPAKTLHRLLEWGPLPLGGFGFRRNELEPLDVDVVVVDEASMIDVSLGVSLLRACPAGDVRVILVGDAHQLPPVGPGRMFGDLIDSGRVAVARLEHVHRAAAKSWICRNAPRIAAGAFAELELEPAPDFCFVEVTAAVDIPEALSRAVTRADTQVLIPQRPGPAGTTAANNHLQGHLNHGRGGDSWVIGDFKIWAGDRVIQTANDYTRNIFNGEVGRVTHMARGKMLVDFDERVVEYDRMSSSSLQLAYALTVHKSQGSEWPHVVVVCHSTHTFMLGRQLIYTALTRARESVTVIGNRAGLKRAVTNGTPARRNTLLPRLLAA